MLIETNIKNIFTGEYSIIEIKHINQTVWKYNPFFKDIIGSPGSKELIAGTGDAGFFGEVPSIDFITGDELANLVGITKGRSQYSNEPWLKFAYESDILFVSKKSFRYGISWNMINDANCVYGDRTVNIKGKIYKIMLMRGLGEDVQPNPKIEVWDYEGKACYNSMWNKLMLPIHQKAPSSWAHTYNVKVPTENWNIGYTDADLNTDGSNGGYTLCQNITSRSECALRGGDEVSGANSGDINFAPYVIGWRPCLQLIG